MYSYSLGCLVGLKEFLQGGDEALALLVEIGRAHV
jgi:hypothetical protein